MMHKGVRVYTFRVVALIGGGGSTLRDLSSVVGEDPAEVRRGWLCEEANGQSFALVGVLRRQTGRASPWLVV